MRIVNPTEHQIQCAIVEWANIVDSPYVHSTKDLIHKKIGDFLIKNANEGKRSWAQGKKMKKEGLKKGVSDLFLAIPASNSAGLWIEVKTIKGKISESQEEWLRLMNFAGYGTALIRSVDEGIKTIKNYLGIK